MRTLKRLSLRLSIVLVALAAWACQADFVWAAAKKEEKAPIGGIALWGPPYTLVLLLILLALMVVLRPSGRRDKPKLEELEQDRHL